MIFISTQQRFIPTPLWQLLRQELHLLVLLVRFSTPCDPERQAKGNLHS